mgnify:CR=1 FL=1
MFVERSHGWGRRKSVDERAARFLRRLIDRLRV